MGNLIASREGAIKLQQAREKRGRNVDSPIWLEEASRVLDPTWKPGVYHVDGVSEGSWRRFLYRMKPIKDKIFKAYCTVLGLNWEDVVDVIPEQHKGKLASYFVVHDVWVGRTELVNRSKKLLQGSCRVLVVAGIAGIGKTFLAERLAIELQDDWVELCRINFDDEGKASNFSDVAAELLTSWKEDINADDRKNPQRLSNLLVRYLKESHLLLIIDSLEAILHGDEATGWSRFRDDWWRKFFQSIMASEFFQSRIIVTSQDLPSELEELGFRYSSFLYCQALNGLDSLEQMELFKKMRLSLERESKSYLERIGSAYEGHPLALRVISGEIISPSFSGNVLAYWKKYGYEIEEIERSLSEKKVEGSHDKFHLDRLTTSLQRAIKRLIERSFERLAKDIFNAYLLLCHGAVYRHPVPEDWWLEHLAEMGISSKEQIIAITALRERYLVEETLVHDQIHLRQHNLIRSVALTHLERLMT